MNEKPIRFEEYTFYTTDVVVSLGIRINRIRIARKDRKNTLITFCNQTGIEYPPKESHKYTLPEKYIVTSDEIDLLHKEQESIAVIILDRYNTIQTKTLTKITEISTNIQSLTEIQQQEMEKFTEYKKKQKEAKSPLEKISAQTNVFNQEAKLKNIQADIDIATSQLKTLETIYNETNPKKWADQTSIIEQTISIEVKKYIQSATAKIRKKLHFAEFSYAQVPIQLNNKLIQGE